MQGLLMRLFADEKCWQFAQRFPDAWVQFGCGPGKFGAMIIPDRLLGISFKTACRIHDWYYQYAQDRTEEGLFAADRIFLNNMLRIVAAAGGFQLLIWLRRRLAHMYFMSVRKWGGPCYHDSRNTSDEFRNWGAA
jgi:hypothetical protein